MFKVNNPPMILVSKDIIHTYSSSIYSQNLLSLEINKLHNRYIEETNKINNIIPIY